VTPSAGSSQLEPSAHGSVYRYTQAREAASPPFTDTCPPFHPASRRFLDVNGFIGALQTRGGGNKENAPSSTDDPAVGMKRRAALAPAVHPVPAAKNARGAPAAAASLVPARNGGGGGDDAAAAELDGRYEALMSVRIWTAANKTDFRGQSQQAKEFVKGAKGVMRDMHGALSSNAAAVEDAYAESAAVG